MKRANIPLSFTPHQIHSLVRFENETCAIAVEMMMQHHKWEGHDKRMQRDQAQNASVHQQIAGVLLRLLGRRTNKANDFEMASVGTIFFPQK